MLPLGQHVSTDHQQHRLRTLWLTGVLHGFTHLYQLALTPLYLYIQKDLGLDNVGQATLLVTVMGAAYFLPSYPIGTLADRWSRKKLLAVGLAINSTGFICLSLSHGYGAAIACVLLSGLGGSFYHPAATALIARLFPEARGKALGWVGVGASIGFFAGPIYSGWRAVATGNWRAPVLELGIFGLVASILFAWLADEEKVDVDLGKQDPTTAISGAGKTSVRLFPNPKLWLIFLAACFAFSLRDFAGNAMPTSASLFLQKAHGFSPGTTGWALSVIYLSSAISNPLFGRMSDGGRGRWAGGVLLASALLVGIFARVPVAWMLPVLTAYGFFFMASYPITEAALMEAVPDAVRGRIFGLFMTIAGLFGNFAHWIIGAWIGHLGDKANHPESYQTLYTLLALLVVGSISGLPFLKAIHRNEDKVAASSLLAVVVTQPEVPMA